MTHCELTRSDHTATVTFVADKGPAILSSSVLGELTELTSRLREESAIRFVVFRSAGKVFIAGADISEMSGMGEDQSYALAQHGQRVFMAIETLPQITFAAMNGHTLGGGCELALACSFRLLVDGAKIGQPEVKLGLIPGWGGTQRLPRIVPLGWALRLLYSGEPISAAQALQIGLVDEVVPSAEALDEALNRWFAMFAAASPRAILRIKRAILSGEEAEQFATCFNCSDAREGMSAFLEKRAAAWSA